MSEVQNIVIRYVTDTKGLDTASKSFTDLTAKEEEMRAKLEQAGKTAKETGTALEDAGNRGKKSMDGAADSTNKLNNLMKNGAGLIAAYFSVQAVSTFAKGVINAYSNMQQFNNSLETMLGSKTKADKLAADLVKFAAKTPFQLTEVQEMTKRLLAMGIEVNRILPTITAMGNIAAGVGADKMPQLTLALGQVKAATRLTGNELRQFTEAGVPMLATLAKNLGKTEAEITKMISAGKIGFNDVEAAIISLGSEGGKFFNLMDKNSATLGGQISNLADAWEQFLVTLGQSANDANLFAPIIKGAQTVVDMLTEAVKSDAVKFGENVSAAYDKIGISIDNLKTKEDILAAQTSAMQGLSDAQDAQSKAADRANEIMGESTKAGDVARNVLWTLTSVTTDYEKKVQLATKRVEDKAASVEAYKRLLLELEQALIKVGKVEDKPDTKTGILEQLKIDLKAQQVKQLEATTAAEIKAAGIEIRLIQERIKHYEALGERKKNDLKETHMTVRGLEWAIEEQKRIITEFSKFLKNQDLQLLPETSPNEIDKMRSLSQMRIDYWLYENEEKVRIAQDAAQALAGLADTLYSGQIQRDQERLESLEMAYARDIELAGDNVRAKEEIERDYEQKRKDIEREIAETKRKQAILSKGIAASQAITNTAVAVMRAFADTGPFGGPIFAAIIGAIGAAQVATILAQPIPKFAKGVIDLQGPGTETSDSIVARLSKGESVMTAQETRENRALLEGIRAGNLPEWVKDFDKTSLQLARMQFNVPQGLADIHQNNVLEEKLDQLNATLQNLPIHQTYFDQHGVQRFIQQGNSRTRHLNSRI